MMDYHFHEIRKGERAKVLSFAKKLGFTHDSGVMLHRMSLLVESDGEMVAAALCLEQEPGRVVIELVAGAAGGDQSLITELTDRCLRKVQAEGIASARIHSLTQEPTDTIWAQTNWLSTIDEAAPPEQVEPADSAA